MISKTEIPQNSLLRQTGPYDYEDSFSIAIIDAKNKITVDDVVQVFMTSSPTWVKMLMTLRNKIVAPFGLKTGTDTRQITAEKMEFNTGSRIGLFKIMARNENEIIVGEDDKHLNFKVSLWLRSDSANGNNKEVILSTAVNFNNWLGRLYFAVVKPFHKLIVPVMMKQMAKQLHGILH